MQDISASPVVTEPSVLRTSALIQDHNRILNPKCSDDSSSTGFSIRYLPYEIRHLIYTHHLATSPSLPITPLNATLPLHQTHSIYSSSPYFQGLEIPSSVYHTHQTFTFTSGTTMRQFSELFDRQHEVRRIEIMLNSPDDAKSHHRDWIWLIQECFTNIADITLVLPTQTEETVCSRAPSISKGWWSCVEDAFREGMGFRTVEWLLASGGGDAFSKRFPRLSLVDGEGKTICWTEYRGEGRQNDAACLL